MAIEQNPFEQINPMQDNVVPLPMVDESKATFELDDDGGVLVDFAEEENIEMGAEESVGEWFRNLRDDVDEDELSDIGRTLYDNYESDKDSRSEWESMFERGFDLLGLKIEEASELNQQLSFRLKHHKSCFPLTVLSRHRYWVSILWKKKTKQ